MQLTAKLIQVLYRQVWVKTESGGNRASFLKPMACILKKYA